MFVSTPVSIEEVSIEYLTRCSDSPEHVRGQTQRLGGRLAKGSAANLE